MIKSHIENVIKQEEVVDDVICNMCGNKVSRSLGEICDHVHVVQSWGYFSNKDTERHTFDLCEDCYDKIVGQFKIPVDIQEDII
ncbi:MAG: hypothetical protein ACP5M6_03765 [Methanobrevibacter sp.]